ncbi:hypothetical protein FNF31_01369 [Cafeteria roenbergensis]|uniref:OB domain-containing protein n=1 Tax=Cafeteria roenbergensis TaxID=33653 RepID=A0A5A8DS44_CAFRO|nr:hypothetical protein FNF31_01369 [Cafeteria roenbergensis]
MDPMFSTPVRVLGAHVLQMPEAGPSGVFLLYGRPVQSVEVCGFLSALDEREDAVTMSLDDGSGVPVEVTVWRRGFDGSARLVVRGLELGDVVRASGRIRQVDRGGLRRTLTADRVHGWGGPSGDRAARALTVAGALNSAPRAPPTGRGPGRAAMQGPPLSGLGAAGDEHPFPGQRDAKAWAALAARPEGDGVPFVAGGVARLVTLLASRPARGHPPVDADGGAGAGTGAGAGSGTSEAGEQALSRHWQEVDELHRQWYARPVTDVVPAVVMTADAQAFWRRWDLAETDGAQPALRERASSGASLRGDGCEGDRGHLARAEAAGPGAPVEEPTRVSLAVVDSACAAVVRWLLPVAGQDSALPPHSVPTSMDRTGLVAPWQGREAAAASADGEEGDEVDSAQAPSMAGAADAAWVGEALEAGCVVRAGVLGSGSAGVSGGGALSAAAGAGLSSFDKACEPPARSGLAVSMAAPAGCFVTPARLAGLAWFGALVRGTGLPRGAEPAAAAAELAAAECVSRLTEAGVLLSTPTAAAAVSLLRPVAGVLEGPGGWAARVREAWLEAATEAQAAAERVEGAAGAGAAGAVQAVTVVTSIALLRAAALRVVEQEARQGAGAVSSAAVQTLAGRMFHKSLSRISRRRWLAVLRGLECEALIVAADEEGTRFRAVE